MWWSINVFSCSVYETDMGFPGGLVMFLLLLERVLCCSDIFLYHLSCDTSLGRRYEEKDMSMPLSFSLGTTVVGRVVFIWEHITQWATSYPYMFLKEKTFHLVFCGGLDIIRGSFTTLLSLQTIPSISLSLFCSYRMRSVHGNVWNRLWAKSFRCTCA